MRSVQILALLAIIALWGCDAAEDWLRGPPAATAYATSLASDTTVVTTRRVWSSSWPDIGSPLLPDGTVMPDGTGMVVRDSQTGQPAVLDLASGEIRPFRVKEPYDTGGAGRAVPSPDGSRVLFSWWPDGLEQRQIRILDGATGRSRTILTWNTLLLPIAWTPTEDSVFVAVYPRTMQGEVEVLLIPAAGGTPRLLHSIPMDWTIRPMGLSPDGRWLVYTHERSCDEEMRSDIYIIDVQNGGAHALVEHPGTDVLAGWAPGTDVVLFFSDRSGTTDLWSIRVVNGRASGEPRLVRSGLFRSHPVGFGGGALFYTVGTGSQGHSVVNVDPQRGTLLGVASPPFAEFFVPGGRPVWSPDGQSLASPTRQRGSYGVIVRSMGTGDTRVFWLGDEGVRAFAVEWAADGRTLLLRVGALGSLPTDPHHFLRLDLITGNITKLFGPVPAEPGALLRFAVMPDGRAIVLRQRRTLDEDRTGINVVLRSLDDGSERELYRTAGFIPELSLSADGTQLAFVQHDRGAADSLFVMTMDGSQPLRTIAAWDHEVSLLGWLPAGNSLLGARLTEDRKQEEILRIALDGSVAIVGISPFPPRRGRRVEGNYRSQLLLAPAGNRLLHSIFDVGQELWRMDGLPELFATDFTGRR